MTCGEPNATGNLQCTREPDHGDRGHVWEHTVTHPEPPSEN